MSVKQEKKYAGETVFTGSGNVFADLGLPNPEERLAKAQLVQRIAEVIKERELTQKQAGTILEIDQAKVSKLVRGKLSEFSTSTLIDYLTRLDQDVEIVVRPKLRSKDKASLQVTIPETRMPSETQAE
jgi:predicted XRE-type DNA-binding protein